MWGHLSSPPTEAVSGRGNANSGVYSYMAVAPNMMAAPYGGGGPMPAVAPPHDRSHEVCKYFVNGGCVRGSTCPYSHELPDERHLDVNGFGFILNPNVHNAPQTVAASPASPQGLPSRVSPTMQGTSLAHSVSSQGSVPRSFPHGPKQLSKLQAASTLSSPLQIPSMKLSPPPKYCPPEPYLEYDLPPALALQMKGLPDERAITLAHAMLQS